MSSPETPTPPNDPNDKDFGNEIKKFVQAAQLFVMQTGENVTKEQAREYVEHITDIHGTGTLCYSIESIKDDEGIGKLTLLSRNYGSLDLRLELFIPDEKMGKDEDGNSLMFYGYFKVMKPGVNNSTRSFFDDITIDNQFVLHNALEADVVDCTDEESADMDRILDDLGYGRESEDIAQSEELKEYSLTGPITNNKYMQNIVQAIRDAQVGHEWRLAKHEDYKS